MFSIYKLVTVLGHKHNGAILSQLDSVSCRLYFEVHLSNIRYHHIRVNVWALESC